MYGQVRLYEHLFTDERPFEHEDPFKFLNPNSLTIVYPSYADPSIAAAVAPCLEKVHQHYSKNDASALDGAQGVPPGALRFQFERMGYFCVDPDTKVDRIVVNCTVTLKDSFHKEKTEGKGKETENKSSKKPAKK